MSKIARLFAIALGLASLAAPALAAVCSPTPALPDSERRTEYAGIVAQTGPFNVGFQLYGDGTDFQNWISVWVNGVALNGPTDFTVTSPSGPLANLCRPITDAQVTFTAARTGTIEIEGSRRPRRASQFSENAGVTARSLNQVLSDMESQLRERWDRQSRLVRSPPGETLAVLPPAASRAGKFLMFDATGLIPQVATGGGSGNVVGPVSSNVGDIATWNNTTGTLLADSGSPTISAGGFIINPTASSIAQGIAITQTSPTTGSVAGPLVYNNIAINNQSGVTGSGATNDLLNASTRGFQVNFTEGGPNISGIQSAAVFQLNHTVGNSAATGGDHVATISAAYSNKVETGGGGLYGLDAISYADAGASQGAATAINAESFVHGSATVPYRLGIEVTNIGPARGSTFDAAIAIDNTDAGGAFLTGISFGANPIRPQPIATTGSLFSTAQNFTVANIMNMPGLTVTGNYFNLGHLAISGTGFISSAANTAALPTAPTGTQIQASAGDGTATFILADSFSTNLGALFLSRGARGTSALPTALQSGDLIGGWAGFGRGATGYSATGRASFLCTTSQIWTDTAQGSYCEIGTTANGSTTQTVRARVENDGGILIPATVTGGTKGAGTINISGNYYIGGNQVIACTSASPACLDNITGFAVNGLIARTGAGAYSARTIGSGTGITVTNGDGVAGAPSVALTVPVTVALGGTNCTSASGTCLDNIAGFASTGILARTGSGAYAARTLQNGGGLTWTNPDGVSGNPSAVVSISTNANFLLGSGVAAGFAPNVTNYAGFGSICGSAAEVNCQVPISAPVTMKNLYAVVVAAAGAGQSYTFTLRKNLADTTVTCAISGASAVSCNDTTHTVSYVAGDLIDMKMVSSATATSLGNGPNFAMTAVTTSP